MRNRVLYFPYIHVPHSAWLAQLVLYWDQVCSIVPLEYVEKPEVLGPFMRALVHEELIWQVHPAAHLYDLQDFAPAFQRYIENKGPAVQQRARRFRAGNRTPIHMEKVENLGEFLIDHGLARRTSHSWYDVEANTAAEFMTYLATTLGQLAQVDAVPITDKPSNLRRLTDEHGMGRDVEFQRIRQSLIRSALPIPTELPTPREIRRFKDQHQHMLGPLRRRIEREVIDMAALSDPDLRHRRAVLFAAECEEHVVELGAAMHRRGWAPILGNITAIVAAIPGVHAGAGLISAVWQALVGSRHHLPAPDFAYAAHVQFDLGHRRFAPNHARGLPVR